MLDVLGVLLVRDGDRIRCLYHDDIFQADARDETALGVCKAANGSFEHLSATRNVPEGILRHHLPDAIRRADVGRRQIHQHNDAEVVFTFPEPLHDTVVDRVVGRCVEIFRRRCSNSPFGERLSYAASRAAWIATCNS